MCHSGWGARTRGYKGQLTNKLSILVASGINLLCMQALSGKDEPYHNCFLYDGVNSTGIVESLRPSP